MTTVDLILDRYAGGARPADPRTIDKVPVYGVWFAIDAAAKAGFRGEHLVVMGALAGRESWWNPWVTNLQLRETGDLSYGLWQINTAHKETWELMRQQLGFGLGAIQLLDPHVNARAARWLFDRSPDIPFRAWGPYKGQPPLWGSAARNVQVAFDVAKFFGYVS